MGLWLALGLMTLVALGLCSRLWCGARGRQRVGASTICGSIVPSSPSWRGSRNAEC